MTGILSLITYLPLLGVAAILGMRAIGRPRDRQGGRAGAKLDRAGRHPPDPCRLGGDGGALRQPHAAGYQFEEHVTWFAGAGYRMGVDGISVLFVLLTAFLMPICIISSWNSIKEQAGGVSHRLPGPRDADAGRVRAPST